MQIFDTHGMGSYRSDRIHRRQYIRIPYRVCGRVLRPLLQASGKISKHIEWMWVMFLDILFGYKDMRIINACIPLIKTNQYKGILCSTYRTFPLTAAKTLAIHTNLPFVVDLRDIIEQYASNEYISHKFHTFSWLDAFITKRFRKRLLKSGITLWR